ncbi:EKC/KEOPS complex subunit Lage3 isoform X2 [Thalassophryne amazonica]|uniref:EKC/KEOPS complex subunit Lage3 isoform X2 n=1 Tax=Thalassophryne amazonica TaxID=390379 RepID=UPI00147109B4|nr:EKC/KEOPS complex subunit Lage3 isoform X2 [Thalassophryne amazonica]
MMAAVGENHQQEEKLRFSVDIPFPSAREASVALKSLSPDEEPRRGGISKRLTVCDNILRWSAAEARTLRVSVSSFLDHLALVMETMQIFSPAVPQ